MTNLLVTAFNPFISRNLLAGDFLNTLKNQKDLQVVLVVPDYKKGFFEKNFGGGNVVVEGVPVRPPSKREIIFKYLASSLVETATLVIHKEEKLSKDRRLFRYLFSRALMKLGKLNIVKKIAREMDYRSSNKNFFSPLFHKYSPVKVFATDVFNDDDVRILQTARRFGVPTIGMVRSWDNITTKGLFRAKPGKLVAHNEIIKGEAERYEDMPTDKIFVSGLPQFDIYFRGGHQSREEFFKKIGFDSAKKLVLFSPFGNRFWDLDWQILEILKKTGHQILARMTPQDLVDLSKFETAPNVYIDHPGQRFHENKARDAELGREDLQWLSDSLYYSDLIVTCGATLGMDGAVFDKPVVMVGFDPHTTTRSEKRSQNSSFGVGVDGWEKRSYIKSVERFLKFDHPQIVYRTGGFKVARNEGELNKMMDDYLKNPSLDRENRQQMIKEFCVYLDGKCGERLGKFIVSETAATQ